MSLFTRDRTFVIAEAGINHNGLVNMAMDLVDAAKDAGADAVKFQIRTPHMSLPPELWNQERDTPWGVRMTYLEYRQRIELSPQDLAKVEARCREKSILFSASAWDVQATSKLLNAPFVKVASASVTNLPLVAAIGRLGKPTVMSTGMCNLREIEDAVKALGPVPELVLLVCTSSYPALPQDLNLARIEALQDHFSNAIIGYSGHEVGLWTSLCAVALGARVVERHLTLDRSLPGTDQAASVEPKGLALLVREIRQFEKAYGSPDIGMLACEKGTAERLRGKQNMVTGATQEPVQCPR